METPRGLSYKIENDSAFAGLRTTDYPVIHADIVSISPLFIEMLRRVRTTGTPEHFKASWSFGGAQMIKNAPSVMYRNDNPAEPEREGRLTQCVRLTG